MQASTSDYCCMFKNPLISMMQPMKTFVNITIKNNVEFILPKLKN